MIKAVNHFNTKYTINYRHINNQTPLLLGTPITSTKQGDPPQWYGSSLQVINTRINIIIMIYIIEYACVLKCFTTHHSSEMHMPQSQGNWNGSEQMDAYWDGYFQELYR